MSARRREEFAARLEGVVGGYSGSVPFPAAAAAPPDQPGASWGGRVGESLKRATSGVHAGNTGTVLLACWDANNLVKAI